MYICKGVFPEKFDQRSNFFPTERWKIAWSNILGRLENRHRSNSVSYRIQRHVSSDHPPSCIQSCSTSVAIPCPRKTEDITGVDFRLYIFVLVVVELCIAYPEREESKRFEKGRRGEKRDREKKRKRNRRCWARISLAIPFLERERRKKRKERKRKRKVHSPTTRPNNH